MNAETIAAIAFLAVIALANVVRTVIEYRRYRLLRSRLITTMRYDVKGDGMGDALLGILQKNLRRGGR